VKSDSTTDLNISNPSGTPEHQRTTSDENYGTSGDLKTSE